MVDENGAMGRKMTGDMIGWIDRKVKKMIAEACAEETPAQEQKRIATNVAAIAAVLTLVGIPLLLIVAWICLHLAFS
jgi:uncharacterized membrane protein